MPCVPVLISWLFKGDLRSCSIPFVFDRWVIDKPLIQVKGKAGESFVAPLNQVRL